jgi:hypothetical protein
MNKERELLRRVKVLLECSNMEPLQDQADIIIKEIKELIAETKQEPVAWKTEKKSYLDEIDRLSMEANKDQEEIDRLTQWLTQPERKPLTDEDICEILIKKEWKGFVDLVRIIEKAHGIGVDDE